MKIEKLKKHLPDYLDVKPFGFGVNPTYLIRVKKGEHSYRVGEVSYGIILKVNLFDFLEKDIKTKLFDDFKKAVDDMKKQEELDKVSLEETNKVSNSCIRKIIGL